MVVFLLGVSNELTMGPTPGNIPYVEYFSLDKTAYREKVRYYEENFKNIIILVPEERIELDIDYCLCLFELGRYQRFLQKVDPVIEEVIYENIYEYMAVNIYIELLFKKAACLFNLNQLTICESLLGQIVRMDPTHHEAATLLAISKRKSGKDLFVLFKAMAVVCIFMAISITIGRIILIEPFYDTYMGPFLWLRNIFIGMAIVFLLVNETLINREIFRETGRFPYAILNKIHYLLFGQKK